MRHLLARAVKITLGWRPSCCSLVDSFATIPSTTMRHHRHASPLPSRLMRVAASLVAAMVIVLTLSSASPELHVWLHGAPGNVGAHHCGHAHHVDSPVKAHAPAADSDQTGAHQCAVTLFSHGVVYESAPALTQPCEGILRAIHFRAFERQALAHPRYLHLPPQAPPAV